MKKLLMILLSISIIFSLTACKKQETAIEATEKALGAIKSFDPILAANYFDLEELSSKDIPIDIDIKDLDKSDYDKAKLIVKNFDYKIISANEKENVATVKVEMTNLDFKELFMEYFTYALSISLTETDEAVVEAKLDDKMLELLKQDNQKLVTTEVDLSLSRINDQWKIDLNATIVNAILGGIVDVVGLIED